MKDKIEINNIVFEKYNPSDLEHSGLILKLAKENNIDNNFDNWQEMLKDSLDVEQMDDTYAYVVGLDNKLIGIFTVSFNMDNSAIIYQKLLPKYFNKLAVPVRNIMIEELAANNIDRVATIIKDSDEVAKKSLFNSGYSDESFVNMGDIDYIQVTLYDRNKGKQK